MLSLLAKKKKKARQSPTDESAVTIDTFEFDNENLDIEGLSAFVERDADSLEEQYESICAAIKEMFVIIPESYLDVWSDLKQILVKRRLLFERNKEIVQAYRAVPPPVPIAPVRPTVVENPHGDSLKDNYAYLRDWDDEHTQSYMEAEESYFQFFTQRPAAAALQNTLYEEFLSRADEHENPPPMTHRGDYSYYARFVPGKQYPLRCRRHLFGPEQVYLDANALAEQADSNFFELGIILISPDQKMLVYGVDTTGGERFDVRIKDLASGELYEETLNGVGVEMEFLADSRHFLYLLPEEDTERPYKLMRHKIGTPVSSDVLVFEEKDELFALYLTKTEDDRFIILSRTTDKSTATLYLRADDIEGSFAPLFTPEDGVEYRVESDGGDVFYVLTNRDGNNHSLMRFPLAAPQQDNWEVVVPVRDFVLIDHFEVRRHHIVLYERSGGVQNIRVINTAVRDEHGNHPHHYIHFNEVIYTVAPESEEGAVEPFIGTPFDSSTIRFTFSSLVQPKQVILYDMDTRVQTVLYTQKVRGYEKEHYASRRLFATSVDGTAVPISIVFRKDLISYDSPAPCILHVYGAYGVSIDPTFANYRVSILDRGFIFAIAHVRGGAEMGSAWYEGGKLLNKFNTFHDFIACADFLIKEKYTSPDKLSIHGKSAGGLTIAAVLNMRPDICKVALMLVPFLDCLNTMLDATLPCTVFEYDEWGNPSDRERYMFMKSYCPYTNIRQQAYPHLLIRSGINDARVGFWESLKYTAKLRAHKLDNNLLLLNLVDAGHGGNSGGQYGVFEDFSVAYATLIELLGSSRDPIPYPASRAHAAPHPVSSKAGLGAPLPSPVISPQQSPPSPEVSQPTTDRASVPVASERPPMPSSTRRAHSTTFFSQPPALTSAARLTTPPPLSATAAYSHPTVLQSLTRRNSGTKSSAELKRGATVISPSASSSSMTIGPHPTHVHTPTAAEDGLDGLSLSPQARAGRSLHHSGSPPLKPIGAPSTLPNTPLTDRDTNGSSIRTVPDPGSARSSLSGLSPNGLTLTQRARARKEKPTPPLGWGYGQPPHGLSIPHPSHAHVFVPPPPQIYPQALDGLGYPVADPSIVDPHSRARAPAAAPRGYFDSGIKPSASAKKERFVTFFRNLV